MKCFEILCKILSYYILFVLFHCCTGLFLMGPITSTIYSEYVFDLDFHHYQATVNVCRQQSFKLPHLPYFQYNCINALYFCKRRAVEPNQELTKQIKIWGNGWGHYHLDMMSARSKIESHPPLKTTDVPFIYFTADIVWGSTR